MHNDDDDDDNIENTNNSSIHEHTNNNNTNIATQTIIARAGGIPLVRRLIAAKVVFLTLPYFIVLP